MVAPFAGRISRSMVRIPGSGMKEDAAPVCLNLGNVSQFAAIVPVPQSVTFKNGRRLMTSSFTSTNQKLAGETTTSPATSLPNGDVIKTEDARVESHRGSFSSEAVSSTQLTNVQDVVGRRPQSSAPSFGSQNVRGGARKSGTKRSIGQESTVERDVNDAKRFKYAPVASAQQNVRPSQSNKSAPAVMSLPNGTWNNNVSLPSVPLVLQGITPSGIPLAVPLQSTSGATPAFVLQASGGGGGKGTTMYQPAAVLMATRKVLPGTSSTPSGPSRPYLQQMVWERDQLRKENESLKCRLYRFQQLLKNKQKLVSVLRRLESVPLPAAPLQAVPS